MSTTNSTVHLGVWMNHEKGSTLGRTLTVTSRNGSVLVALLALFVSVSGNQCWGMICYLVHQLRTTRQAKHGIHFQQQASLRNHGSVLATIWQLCKVSWSWRAQKVQSIQRSTSLVLLGVGYLLVFSAAGIFSSSLATVKDEVLVRSPNCGLWMLDPTSTLDDFEMITDFNVHQRANADLSKAYVRDCLSGYRSTPECNTFKQRELPFRVIKNGPCPFSPGMCLGPVNSTLVLDSGLLDSTKDLGINSVEKDRIQYRKVTTCSPITVDGYMEHGILKTNGRDINYTAAHYGQNSIMNSSLPLYGEITNATYVHTNHKDLSLGYDGSSGESVYNLHVVSAFPLTSTYGFIPIPALESPKSTLNLIFLSFTGYFIGQSDDLWIPGHKNLSVSMNDPGYPAHDRTLYMPDNQVSVLACTDQHQVCNPNRGTDDHDQCSELLAWEGVADILLGDAASDKKTLLDTRNQRTTADVIMMASLAGETYQMIPFFHAPLLASDYAVVKLSKPLPKDQWVIEATNWFATSLNIIQRYVTETATGAPGSDGEYTYNQSANDTKMQWYCNNQIVRNNAYTSFSVLALSLILGFGGFAILSSLWLETIVGWIQTRVNRGTYQKLSWNLDGALQLQRMAFEEAGLGTWKNCASEIPLLESTEMIKLPEWDALHPTIRGGNGTLISADIKGEAKMQHLTLVTETSEITLDDTLSGPQPSDSQNAEALVTENVVEEGSINDARPLSRTLSLNAGIVEQASSGTEENQEAPTSSGLHSASLRSTTPPSPSPLNHEGSPRNGDTIL